LSTKQGSDREAIAVVREWTKGFKKKKSYLRKMQWIAGALMIISDFLLPPAVLSLIFAKQMVNV